MSIQHFKAIHLNVFEEFQSGLKFWADIKTDVQTDPAIFGASLLAWFKGRIFVEHLVFTPAKSYVLLCLEHLVQFQ